MALGTPAQVAEHLKRIEQLGCHEGALRITGWSQREQLEQLIAEMEPHVEAALP